MKLTEQPVLGERGLPIKVQKTMRLGQDTIRDGSRVAKEQGISFSALIDKAVAKEVRAHDRRARSPKK